MLDKAARLGNKAVGIRFSDTVDLGKTTNEVRYSFVIVRTGLRYPDNTKEIKFPNDNVYEKKWEAGRVSKDGKDLMGKVARSLKTRYSFTAIAPNAVTITVAKKSFVKECSQSLVKEIYQQNSFAPTIQEVDYDKLGLFYESTQCPEYDRLVKEQEENRVATQQDVKYSSEYSQLRFDIGGDKSISGEWKIQSPKQVYWLQQIIEYQKRKLKEDQTWMTPYLQKQIEIISKEYLRDVISADKNMASFLVGTLFQQIINDYNEHTKSLHIHLTDDRIYAAFKYVLTGAAPEIPEFGETLVIEVYHSNTISDPVGFRVFTFFPYHSSEKRLPRDVPLQYSTTDFKFLITEISKRLNLISGMNELQWSALCNPEPKPIYDWRDRTLGASDPWSTSGASGHYLSSGREDAAYRSTGLGNTRSGTAYSTAATESRDITYLTSGNTQGRYWTGDPRAYASSYTPPASFAKQAPTWPSETYVDTPPFNTGGVRTPWQPEPRWTP